MEEDDLLGGEWGQKQDLRVQIQKGGEAKLSQIKQDSKEEDWIKGIESWRGLGEEGTSTRGDGSRADSKDSKGAGLTINKGIGTIRGGIEGIVAPQTKLLLSHSLKVQDLVPLLK